LVISGLILKNALKKSGLTQMEAAGKLGVSRQTLNSWCSKSSLDEEVIDQVKSSLDIDLFKIADGSVVLYEQPKNLVGEIKLIYELLAMKDKYIEKLEEEIGVLKDRLDNQDLGKQSLK